MPYQSCNELHVKDNLASSHSNFVFAVDLTRLKIISLTSSQANLAGDQTGVLMLNQPIQQLHLEKLGLPHEWAECSLTHNCEGSSDSRCS